MYKKEQNYSKNKKCICGKSISNNAKRCNSCHIKWQIEKGFVNNKGKNNGMYGRIGVKHPSYGIKRPDVSKRMKKDNSIFKSSK
ncbi:hypothetical protein LCGC14_1432020 [marine sediment metagenome]|uniref:Uncharacterized protein n=1 Tax=marine sediment metagenome TaxID=412755 RepID=A0A0F9M3V6_9ZZZZ